MENYDIFEVKANNFGQLFNQMYPDKPLKLIDAESKTDIILYAEFSPNKSIEVHPEIECLLPIIYTNVKGNEIYFCYFLDISDFFFIFQL